MRKASDELTRVVNGYGETREETGNGIPFFWKD